MEARGELAEVEVQRPAVRISFAHNLAKYAWTARASSIAAVLGRSHARQGPSAMPQGRKLGNASMRAKLA